MTDLQAILRSRRVEGQVVGQKVGAPASSSVSSPRLARLAATALLTLAALSASGCGVNVTDHTPSQQTPAAQSRASAPPAPKTGELHDLSVAAVDFDPALDPQQLAFGKPYSLLVAVENKGNRKEEGVVVSAQLFSDDHRTLLISSQQSISRLAPGDLTVVKFPGATANLPKQRAYSLTVQVQPCSQETNTLNNSRTLDIQVNAGN